MYQKKITLLEAIQSDKHEVMRDVTLRLPIFSQYEQAFIDADGHDETLGDLMISACTGLTQTEIERLKTPDFNTLNLWVGEHTTKPADYFFALDDKQVDKNTPMLLQPLRGFDKVVLTTPSVKASRMMTKIENANNNPFAQGKYLVTACTDLMDNHINELSMPDWNQIQLRLNDFLNQASDYFQSQI